MTLKRITLTIALTVGCLTASAQGGQVLRLTLDEAQQYAVEHNATMLNASLDVKKAELAKWKTLSSMLPQVKAGFDYQNMCGYEMNFGGRSSMSMASMMPESVTLGTLGTFPLTFNYPATTESTESSGIPMNPSGTFSITASMALTGAQIVGVMLQNISKEMADITRQQTERQTRSSVKNVYVSILVMEQTTGLLDSSLANLERLAATTQATPLALRARGACSRLEPQPKLRPATRMSPRCTDDAKDGSISSMQCAASSWASDVLR